MADEHAAAIPNGGAPTIPQTNGTALRDSNGWDGKLRVGRRAEVANAEILSDPEYSDEDAPPVEQIAADDDLLDDYEEDTDEIDLVHRRISSIPPLRLERFPQVEKLCLRQNAISHINFPDNFGARLQELDLYDNLISQIKGLEAFRELTSLDLSFNKIKHLKHVNHLKNLTDIYFVQNKISKIEGLEGLDKLRNLELAANRIREIENLESLTSLEELWLGKNKITELNACWIPSNLSEHRADSIMQNISHFPRLKILSIQSNRLASITGLSTLTSLEEIYISHNVLTSIDPSSLASNPNLRVLDISNNKIAHLENLSHLENLEELWASSNLISSFEEVEKELGGIEGLETVYFEGNPLQLRSPALYRNKVRLALPQIKQIDAIEGLVGAGEQDGDRSLKDLISSIRIRPKRLAIGFKHL